MKCPFCGDLDLKVIESRSTRDETAVRRRRECLNCKQRFTTYEYIEQVSLTVQKLDDTREPFNRSKLERGIVISLAKRPVSADETEKMVAEIEEQCYQLGRQEVSSAEIGEMVMEKLRHLDEVAYIRFASVYRRFQDAGEFKKEIDKL